MEKRVWENPLTMVQQFVPNEYVAACGDENKVYKFKCDAPVGLIQGWVYLETNGVPGLQRLSLNPDTFLGGPYHPCGETHEAPVTDDFKLGYYCKDLESIFDPEQVIVWGGPDNNNIHCTTNLNTDSWETAKS